jgi:3-methyladenine DNA glycosylase AlkD
MNVYFSPNTKIINEIIMETYINELRVLFEKNTVAENIAPMRDYMRGQFDFFGIKSPHRKAITKDFIAQFGYPTVEEMPEFMYLIWDEPCREMHYAGLDILEKFIKKMPEEAIDLYEFLIIHHSWWDTVDMIASKMVGGHLKRFTHLIPSVNKHFLEHEDMWLNRTALLFQLKYKKDTDTDLLAHNIHRLIHRKEFFIRKAIGWVLREYSRTDARFVQNFVNHHEHLSPLSQKEALKLITNSL